MTPYDLLFPKMWVLVPNALHIGKFKTEYNRRVMSPVAELLSTFLQLLLLIRSVDAVGKTVFIKTERQYEHMAVNQNQHHVNFFN